MKDLGDLVESYPDPTRGLRALVLREYNRILAARRRGWGWGEIAASMGKPGSGQALSTTFARVKRRVDSGDLQPPAPAQTSGGRPTKETGKTVTPQAPPTPAAGFEADGFKSRPNPLPKDWQA